MNPSPVVISTMSAAADRIRAALTLDELARVYLDLCGYDVRMHEPPITLDQLRGVCFDYVRECCDVHGVHVRDVGLSGVEGWGYVAN